MSATKLKPKRSLATAVNAGTRFGDTKANSIIKPIEAILKRVSFARGFATTRQWEESVTRKQPTEDPRHAPAKAKMAKRVKKAREARSMTPGGLAEATGIHINTIWLIELGKQNVSAVYMLYIAQALKVDAGWLLGQDKPKPKG